MLREIDQICGAGILALLYRSMRGLTTKSFRLLFCVHDSDVIIAMIHQLVKVLSHPLLSPPPSGLHVPGGWAQAMFLA